MFKQQVYRPTERVRQYRKMMNTERPTYTEWIVDKVMYSVLKYQGYYIEKNTSSYYEVKKLYDALDNFCPSKAVKLDLTSESWRKAINATFRLMGKPEVLPYLQPVESISDIHDNMVGEKGEKSSGLPELTSKEDDFWYALNRSEQILSGKKVPEPCIAYKRTQLGQKVRLVWGYPFSMTLIESRFAVPLIRAFKCRYTPMAAGISKAEIGARVEAINNAYGNTYGLDYSKFDSTISADLIRAAFRILASWFSLEDRIRLGWSKMVNYFIHTPILMPNGRVYTGKKHGVPSGSYFTQLVDSVINIMVQFWLSFELNYNLGRDEFMVLGDDVIISIPRHVTLEQIANKLLTIGLIAHPEKTKRFAHFLGARWVKGIPYRDQVEIIQKMVYPEDFRMYPAKDYMSRHWLAFGLMAQYACVYANVFPMLHKFVGTPDTDNINTALKFYMCMTDGKEWDEKYHIESMKWISFGENEVEMETEPLYSLGALLWA